MWSYSIQNGRWIKQKFCEKIQNTCGNFAASNFSVLSPYFFVFYYVELNTFCKYVSLINSLRNKHHNLYFESLSIYKINSRKNINKNWDTRVILKKKEKKTSSQSLTLLCLRKRTFRKKKEVFPERNPKTDKWRCHWMKSKYFSEDTKYRPSFTGFIGSDKSYHESKILTY